MCLLCDTQESEYGKKEKSTQFEFILHTLAVVILGDVCGCLGADKLYGIS